MTAKARACRHLRTLAILAALLFVGLPATVSAQTLYNNGLPNNSGLMGTNNWTTGGAPIGVGWSTANDFKLHNDATLSYFTWYSLFSGLNGPSPVTASFYWQILTNSVGKPGSVIAGGTVTNAVAERTEWGCCSPQPWEYEAYALTTSLGNITLGAGTYWIAVGNFTSTHGQVGGGHYFWANSLMGSGNEAKRWVDGDWRTLRVEGAFSLSGQVTNTVPEPASIALLATGLGGLGFFGRRRKSKS